VVGSSPSNYSQTVEINRGTECGIKVGMPVLNAAGMIGKVTDVYNKRSVVMLMTDPGYSLSVKIVNAPPTTTTTVVGEAPSDTSSTTSTSTTTTTIKVTTTTGIPGFTPGATNAPTVTTVSPTGSTSPTGSVGPNRPGQSTKSPITVPAGIDLPLKETGALEGRGLTKAPIVRFVENQVRFGDVKVGSPVISAGGATSLAPPDVVIGTISRVIKRSGTLGPILEVQLAADFDYLNFVRVLLYQPSTERPVQP
jgi:rod shape-determining protein MreC